MSEPHEQIMQLLEDDYNSQDEWNLPKYDPPDRRFLSEIAELFRTNKMPKVTKYCSHMFYSKADNVCIKCGDHLGGDDE